MIYEGMLSERNKKLYKPFEVLSITRRDLVSIGYPEDKVLKLTDDDMQYLTGRLSDHLQIYEQLRYEADTVFGDILVKDDSK